VTVLLDTHAFPWWLEDDDRLSRRARAMMSAPGERVLVSVACAWECAVKVPTGKLPQAAAVLANFRSILKREGFDLLDVSLEHILAVGGLPLFHGDPFDRLLVAQALAEGAPIVSRDKALDRYGVRRMW
jgi:PIN domain nuclease of toxin-antitoxin system